MDTIKVGIAHTGSRAVAVHTADGSITVQPGQKIKDAEILPLSEERIDLYKSMGVKFSGLPKEAKTDETDTSELEDAVTEATRKREEALAASRKQGAGDAEKKALQDATDELTKAQKALSDARK